MDLYLTKEAEQSLSLSEEEIKSLFTIRYIAINLTILRYIQNSMENGVIVAITQLLLSNQINQELSKKHGNFLPQLEVVQSLKSLLRFREEETSKKDPQTFKFSKITGKDKTNSFFPRYKSKQTALSSEQLQGPVVVSPEFPEMEPVNLYVNFLETTRLLENRPLKRDNTFILEQKNSEGENVYRVVVPANNLLQLSPCTYLAALLYLQLKPQDRAKEWFFYMNRLFQQRDFPENFKKLTNFSIKDRNPGIICSYNKRDHFLRDRYDMWRKDIISDLAPLGALAVLKLLEVELDRTLNYRSLDEEGKQLSFSIKELESSLMYPLTQGMINRNNFMSSKIVRKTLGIKSEEDSNNNNSSRRCAIQ